MADYVEGIVVKSTSKPTNNGGTVYNICVDTVDNGEEWFGCGFDDPNVNVGDEIGFDIEYKGDYTNVNLDTLEIIKAAPKRESRGSGRGGSRGGNKSGGRGRSSGGSNSGGSKRGGNSRSAPAKKSAGRGASKAAKPDVDWDRKDNLIRLQSSQNTAIATIAVMLTNGALVLPKKKAEAFDAIQDCIEEEAARLFSKYTDIVDGNYDKDSGSGDADDGEYDDDVPD